MLVLSRKPNQEIVVRVPPSETVTEIRFTIVEIRGDKVRVGTTAPTSATIHREEIQDRIDEQEGT